jgi:hypothetical protein
MISHGLPGTPGSRTKRKDDSPAEDNELFLRPRRSLPLLSLALFGVASLSYLFGAAAIYFDLPSSSFLRRAFGGGVSWYEWTADRPPDAQAIPHPIGRIDKPGKTCDGFTLCMYDGGTRAVLLNMRGKVVHEWHVPFHEIWPSPPHVRGEIKDASIYFNDGRVFPNGDLLAVIEGPINMWNPSNGYGLVKLDKDSHVLWKYAEKCHHDLDVAEDGTIYSLVNEIVNQVPKGMEYLPTPCMVDFVDVISPEGKQVKRLPLLEALHDSPYAPLLSVLEKPRREAPLGARIPDFREDERRRDVLHVNSVKVLSRALAEKFPEFKAGQLLLSPRRLDALTVLDPDNGKVVWAARGPWLAQHDPSFLDNGHLLLFDNLGSPRGSRVLEYDMKSQAFPWSYPGESETPFFSMIRGLCQRLPNGNTLIINSEGGEVFEVTPSREIVWSCFFGCELYRARRYTPDQLPFWKGDPREAP